MTQNGFVKNLLICGDNLSALDDLVKKGIKAARRRPRGRCPSRSMTSAAGREP
jgi:hypothetical protein